MKKEFKTQEYKTIVQHKIEQSDYTFAIRVLHFDKKKLSIKKVPYLPAIIEIDFNPLKENTRMSFTVSATSATAATKRILFSPAKFTSSFPLKQRYLLRVPIVEDEPIQRIVFRIEAYKNVFSKEGKQVEFQHKLDVTQML